MTKTERRGWTVLIWLTVIQLFMFGPTSATVGVFFTPLIREFGWTHAQVSRIATAYAFSLGVVGMSAGWLIDRIQAHLVIAVGLVAAATGCLLASLVGSLGPLVACYALIGAGVAFSSWVPMYVLAASWFPNRRGMATGIACVGVALGMSIAPRLTAGIIAAHGWRIAMASLAIPMIAIALPIDLIVIRKPAEGARKLGEAAGTAGTTAASDELPGLEVGAALRTTAFWLMIAIGFLSSAGQGAGYFHAIPFLINVGYSAKAAAVIFGAQAFMAGAGLLLAGTLADRFGTKRMAVICLMLLAASLFALLGARNRALGLVPVIAYIVMWGLDMGYRSVMPVLMLEAMGPRRFGSLSGGYSCADFIGHATGPIVAGMLFDMSHSYTMAFEIAAAAIVSAAVLSAMVFPARGHDTVPARADVIAAAS